MALQIASLVSDYGSNPVNIRFFADKPQAKPVILFARIVPQQDRSGIVDAHENVHRAIIIKIAERHAAARNWPRKNRAALLADILKSFATIPKQQHRFALFNTLHVLFDVDVRMAIAEKQVQLAVIIEIEELHSPAAHEHRPGSDAAGRR